MKEKNQGYTIPEIIVVAALLGALAIFTINKTSYAFEDTTKFSEKTNDLILTKSASVYGENNKDAIKQEKTKYVLGSELIEAGYLAEDEELKNAKIKLEYNETTDAIEIEVIK